MKVYPCEIQVLCTVLYIHNGMHKQSIDYDHTLYTIRGVFSISFERGCPCCVIVSLYR